MKFQKQPEDFGISRGAENLKLFITLTFETCVAGVWLFSQSEGLRRTTGGFDEELVIAHLKNLAICWSERSRS